MYHSYIYIFLFWCVSVCVCSGAQGHIKKLNRKPQNGRGLSKEANVAGCVSSFSLLFSFLSSAAFFSFLLPCSHPLLPSFFAFFVLIYFHLARLAPVFVRSLLLFFCLPACLSVLLSFLRVRVRDLDSSCPTVEQTTFPRSFALIVWRCIERFICFFFRFSRRDPKKSKNFRGQN